MKIPLSKCLLTPANIKNAINEITKQNLVSRVGELSIAVPLYMGLRFLSQEHSVQLVFLGMGADELCGGYKKYTSLYAESGKDQVKLQMGKDLDLLINHQMKMEKKIASKFGVSLFYPFLFPQVINYAQSIPVEDHIVYNSREEPNRKAHLRKLAKDIGLSDNIAIQPKKAIQYGSGTIKILKRIAKEAGYSQLHSWFQSISEN